MRSPQASGWAWSTNGPRSWAEPLIRQLVGDGLVETVVTADDVKKPMPDREAHQNALWELGIPAENALAITGSASGLRVGDLGRSGHGGRHRRRHPGFPGRGGGSQRLQQRWAAAHRGLPTPARLLVGRAQEVGCVASGKRPASQRDYHRADMPEKLKFGLPNSSAATSTRARERSPTRFAAI